MSTARSPSSLMLWVAALCGVLLTTTVLVIDWSVADESREFESRVPFLVWASLACVQSALWATLAVTAWTSLRGLVADYGVNRGLAGRIALLSTAVAILASPHAIAYAIFRPDSPFSAHYDAQVIVIVSAGAAVTALPAIGIWLVEAASAHIPQRPREDQLSEYLRLRDDLRRFLSILAAIVGVATLSIGTLRQAILSSMPGASIPPAFVLYIGAYWSMGVALGYAPAHFALRGHGRHVLHTLQPLPTDRPDSWADWYADRKALEGLLELDITTSKGLQIALVIATPFLTSAVGLLIGTSS